MFNIVFMGTPEFSVPSLNLMIEKFNVKAVVTQPDRPKGRGKKIIMPPIKNVAVEHNIPVYQPLRIRKDENLIKELVNIKPDFIVVVAFGQILPKEILDIPKYGCINLHASLLPKYRGAAPINFALINGETKTGNTTMMMAEGIDTGDMLLREEVEITENMTYGQLHDILSKNGATLLVKTIKNFNSIEHKKQEDSLSSYASMISKEMARINWEMTAKEINNLIRGLNPHPIARTEYNNIVMKIYEAKVLEKNVNNKPGTILNVSKEGIEVACLENTLLVTKVQIPGKKPLEVKEFIKGNTVEVGTLMC
ncbi:methionyl-tRNA formyltransferase [Haloimpatiens sp. FM7315]|uniref:methionyl-tRNA formyltransferase n=1 Tax=Haloimpatiens sp. FM7315 TaxID=3298609 RepID=UPI0035A34E9C